MKETMRFDKWIGILSVSVIAIIVLIFVLTISNTHLAKGTYSTSYTYSCSNGTLDGSKCCTCSGGTVYNTTTHKCSTIYKTVYNYGDKYNLTKQGYTCNTASGGGTTYTCVKGTDRIGPVTSDVTLSLENQGYVCTTNQDSSIAYECTYTGTATCTDANKSSDLSCGSGRYKDYLSCIDVWSECTQNSDGCWEQATTYTATFSNPSGSTGTKTVTCTPSSSGGGCNVKVPSAGTRSGYISGGWTTNNAGCTSGSVFESQSVTISGNVTYYACWAKGGNYTITFLNANGDGKEFNKSCQTNSSGKLDSACISAISSVCGQWSPNKWDGGSPQSGGIAASSFSSMTFTANKTYYCVAGTSIHAGGNSTTTPSSTSKAPSSTTDTRSCYACDVDGSKMYVYATSDSNAASNTGGNNCAIVDDKYCNAPVNPKTGTVGIIVVWVVGIIAIGYSFWYFRKMNSIKIK